MATKCKLPMSTHFTELYDRFNQRIRRYVRSKVSDRQLTDDLVQEIFIKIHDHMDKLNDTDRIDGWIFRISKNKVIDYYRTQRDFQQISKWDNIPNPAVSESNDKLMHELANDTRQFIRQLPDTYRRVIELTELEGKTNKEAAELLGLSLPAVKSRVLRGRKKLKEMFLQCCHFEFDRYGGVVHCTPRRYCPDCINNGIEM